LVKKANIVGPLGNLKNRWFAVMHKSSIRETIPLLSWWKWLVLS